MHRLRRRQKVFFFEKKKQKTFARAVADFRTAHAKKANVFWLPPGGRPPFFQKRT
jgi:hypothetical protein